MYYPIYDSIQVLPLLEDTTPNKVFEFMCGLNESSNYEFDPEHILIYKGNIENF
jgi:hypothetical protein